MHIYDRCKYVAERKPIVVAIMTDMMIFLVDDRPFHQKKVAAE
jgi:hypothetical protein